MNIWQECKKLPLPEVLSFIVDNRGKTVPTDDNGEHILIATNCIRNENLYPSYEKIRLLSEETYQNWFRAHPIPGDIIFVCKGTPGRTCMVPDPIDFCIAQDMVALRANDEIIYNRFLLAVLRSREIQEQIANTSVGDVIPHFKKQFFDQLMIPIPPMDVQRKIGDLYFSFAMKEELNKEINKNLAEQIQAIYNKEFDPVSHTPSGRLSDICQYSSDRIPVSELTISTYFSTENMQPNKAGAVDATSLPSITQTTRCHKGDVLISNIRPYFKKILYVYAECGCSTDVLCFTPKRAELSAFLYGTLFVDRFFDFMVAGSKGTKMPRGDKQQIMNYPIVIPSQGSLKSYNEAIIPMLEHIACNRSEIIRLAALRDTLLPQLMSGELDVSSIII